jgi:hypothetical protein
MGRPTDYAPEMADAICERLADGESLRAICAGEDMPAKATVFRWLAANAEFRDQYARAREAQAEHYVDEVVEIADENEGRALLGDGEEAVAVVFDSTAVARNRLRVDARKWAAVKLHPKKYGERLALAGDPEAPVQVEATVTLEPGDAYLRMLNGG